MIVNYLLFTFLYLGLVNWNRTASVLRGLFKPKLKTTTLDDKRLISFLYKKTGLSFRIKIVEAPQLFGYATGTPFNPYIVLSSGVYNGLTWGELQWVLLHEAGHTKYWHVAKTGLNQLIILLLGIYCISSLPLIAVGPFALLLGILAFQIERIVSEKQADNYAVRNMDNPQNMISANLKFKEYWANNSTVYSSALLIAFFSPHLTYEQRIAMAENEIEKRSNP